MDKKRQIKLAVKIIAAALTAFLTAVTYLQYKFNGNTFCKMLLYKEVYIFQH